MLTLSAARYNFYTLGNAIFSDPGSTTVHVLLSGYEHDFANKWMTFKHFQCMNDDWLVLQLEILLAFFCTHSGATTGSHHDNPYSGTSFLYSYHVFLPHPDRNYAIAPSSKN
ncbi:hypothetical protein D1872_244980 [compost metagenome]